MGVLDKERGLVVSNEKYIGHCAGCGIELLKKQMVTILRKRGYSNPKTVLHLCEECYAELMDEYGGEETNE